MATEKPTKKDLVPEAETYTQNLNYIINIYVQDGGSFQIICNDGGEIKFNSGKPQPFPPPK